MRLFSSLYERVMRWSRHPHAPRYLAVLSFAESSFFPIPPDVMLAPMALANPARAWRLAALTTAASVIGGLAGYLIGLFAFDMVEPLLHSAGYFPKYLQARRGLTSGDSGPFSWPVSLPFPTRFSLSPPVSSPWP